MFAGQVAYCEPMARKVMERYERRHGRVCLLIDYAG